MDKLYRKLSKLWSEHKKEGLLVYSNRQSGKTTALIELAIKELDAGKRVNMWFMNENMKHEVIFQIRKKLGKLPENLCVLNVQNRNDTTTSPNCDFSFYDEVIREKKAANSLAIRSLQPSDGIFIFNIDNTKPLIEKEALESMKAQLSEDQWRTEFMSGVVD